MQVWPYGGVIAHATSPTLQARQTVGELCSSKTSLLCSHASQEDMCQPYKPLCTVDPAACSLALLALCTAGLDTRLRAKYHATTEPLCRLCRSVVSSPNLACRGVTLRGFITSTSSPAPHSCAWGNVAVHEVQPRRDYCYLKTIPIPSCVAQAHRKFLEPLGANS